MKRTFCALALLLAAGGALAQTLQQGQPAPAALVEQMKNVAPTRIGEQAVRVVPPALLSGEPAKAAARGRTLVLRASDNLVGISGNELIVLDDDLEGIATAVAALQLPGAQIHSYPTLHLVLVKTTRFEQLSIVRDRLTTQFPDAKFNLPVTYFPRQRR